MPILGLVSLSSFINWTIIFESSDSRVMTTGWLRSIAWLHVDLMRVMLVYFHWSTNPGCNSFLNGFQSDWITVHIPIQNGFVQGLVLYKTIENFYIKINRKILLSNGKILVVLELGITRWKVKIKMFYIANLLSNQHFIYMKILERFHFFT